MSLFHFPKPFRHEHAPIRNVNEIVEARLTVGQKAADLVARAMGSWAFIGLQSLLLAGWATWNVVAGTSHFDPYPFILMNLFLSLQAAYAAPTMLMSQNRQAARDRLEAHNDFVVDTKSEEEIRVVLEHLEAQNAALQHMGARLDEMARLLGARPPAP